LRRLFLLCLASAMCGMPLPVQAQAPTPARHHMVVAANRIAAEAGLAVLRAGGRRAGCYPR